MIHPSEHGHSRTIIIGASALVLVVVIFFLGMFVSRGMQGGGDMAQNSETRQSSVNQSNGQNVPERSGGGSQSGSQPSSGNTSSPTSGNRQNMDGKEQQDLAQQREDALQKQRDAVPSLLPDPAPTPVQMGHY